MNQPLGVAGSSPAAGGVAGKIVAALDRIARGVGAHRRAVAAAAGLTPLQLDLLRTIADAPPPRPGAGELASELGVSQPTVTDSVIALERKGHVQRRQDPDDRRRAEIALTPSGRGLVHQANGADQVLRAMVAELTPAERDQFLGLLLGSITSLLDADIIQVARTCPTCRYFETEGTGPVSTARCALLEVTLAPADLRVNCPDHRPNRGTPARSAR